MSYPGPGYGRRPHHSNVGYGNEYNSTYRPNHNPNLAPGYQRNYDRDYPPPRYNGYGGHHGSQVAYNQVLPAGAQYITGGRDYYPRHSRNAPVIISGDGHQTLARPSNSYRYIHGNSGYRAEGHRDPISVVNGVSYADEGIPLSTLIRRLFGLGPRRSRGHVGKSIHVKRWDFGFGPGGIFSTSDYRSRRHSRESVYTL